MLLAIVTMGIQIGATAKYEDSRYAFLLPVGIVFLILGLFLWLRGIAGKKKTEE